MTPWQLAKPNTEHANQVAFFAWCAMAARYGERAACDPKSYRQPGYAETICSNRAIEALRHIFAIPNGGLRNKATAARLKAEGVRKGVPDVMLPTYRRARSAMAIVSCGLYLEFKSENGRLTAEQRDYIAYLRHNLYTVEVVNSWQEAVMITLMYLDIVNDQPYYDLIRSLLTKGLNNEQ